jgi:hypothetical protein
MYAFMFVYKHVYSQGHMFKRAKKSLLIYVVLKMRSYIFALCTCPGYLELIPCNIYYEEL